VDVHVDQAGQQGDAGKLDALGAGRGLVALMADRGDLAVDDHHQGLFEIFAAGHVQQPVRAHRHRRRASLRPQHTRRPSPPPQPKSACNPRTPKLGRHA
jgi:hypothetical protein